MKTVLVAIIAGACVTCAGVAVSFYQQDQNDRRAAAEQAEIRSMIYWCRNGAEQGLPELAKYNCEETRKAGYRP